jgi:Fe-S cluster assembly iron-binding protein IscA
MGMVLDEPKENEQPVNINGIDVLIANIVRPFTGGMTVDYVKQRFGQGFVFTGSGDTC